MLSFGRVIVTLHHRGRNQGRIRRQLPDGILQYGNVCREDTLKISEEPDGRRSRKIKTSATITGNWSEVINPTLNTGTKSGHRQKSEEEEGHHRPELFMGRGSQSVTTPPWSCKVTLWSLAVSLLLLSAMITTASPTPVMEGKSITERESDSFGTVDPKSVDFLIEENVEQSIKSPGSPVFENITLTVQSDDELPDNVLFRAERSPTGKKKNKKSGKGENGNKNGDCSRHSIQVKVRDLGLGYDSDELITFFYCMGSCQKSNNYDLTLTTLLKNKRITHSSHKRVSNQPCCRPAGYQPASFLDINNEWQVVEKLSAANCSCGS
ncbi:artemin [Anomaloglossus baeobatrachus]|uniref:artemin n=1 Tax=Anomaloglossus baeobatrachus TaxID=238106 RepID=UPI003F4F6045